MYTQTQTNTHCKVSTHAHIHTNTHTDTLTHNYTSDGLPACQRRPTMCRALIEGGSAVRWLRSGGAMGSEPSSGTPPLYLPCTVMVMDPCQRSGTISQEEYALTPPSS